MIVGWLLLLLMVLGVLLVVCLSLHVGVVFMCCELLCN